MGKQGNGVSTVLRSRWFMGFPFILHICVWLCWIFLAACGLSLVGAGAAFSLKWLLFLWSLGFRVRTQ